MKLSQLTQALVPFALLACSSCAAIFDGSHDEVTIQSDPPGQTIQVDGVSYTTPATVELESNEHHTVTGPRGETYPIHSRPNRLAVIESLFILPILPDYLVGAYTTLEPSVVQLSSENAPVAQPPEVD